MDQSSGQKHARDYLYPPIEPFDRQMIDVGDGHQVYFEQCGNPQGVPVIVLHGGPGGGCSPMMRRFFDPAQYRVILFDQRGCGRSVPHAEIQNNTTWDLIEDIERIRTRLGISDAVIFGGSWGATLALVYAITHPSRVLHLVLRGVFLMTKAELQWFYGGGAAVFFPDQWAQFIAPIPQDEHHDLIAAYHKRLFSGNRNEEMRHAQIWTAWENALSTVANHGRMQLAPSDYAHSFARLEAHYFRNNGFLEGDDWILRHKDILTHIPATIIQGRYDMICPPISAHRLVKDWPMCQLRYAPTSGHALSEPEISSALISVMDALVTPKTA